MTPGTKILRIALAATAGAVLTFVAIAASGGLELALATHPDLGAVLTDGEGNSLYLFSNDAQGESKCYETCAENWPPVVTEGEVTVGEGVDATLVGTSTRSDGSAQVTYGGWPLYRFVGDTEPGQANGEGLNDVWYVVNAAGGAASPTTPVAATSDDALFEEYMAEGAKVFARICASCHGANGDEPIETHVAILTSNSRLENERRVLRQVIQGGGYMPGFGTALSDRQAAAVATFVRNSFGNEYGLVREEAAAANR